MFSLTCEYCGEVTTYAELAERPDICTRCNTSLQDVEAVSTEEPVELPRQSGQDNTSNSSIEQGADTRKLNGLQLTYQTTGASVQVPHAEMIILGRTNVGQEVLSAIPHISRRHCIIEYVNGRYVVTDAGSMNGTFVGTSKINCGENPRQPIEDGSLLLMGKEPFKIQLHYEDVSTIDTDVAISVEEQSTETKTIIYRCKQCGNEFKTHDDICSSCGSYDSMESVKQSILS